MRRGPNSKEMLSSSSSPVGVVPGVTWLSIRLRALLAEAARRGVEGSVEKEKVGVPWFWKAETTFD